MLFAVCFMVEEVVIRGALDTWSVLPRQWLAVPPARLRPGSIRRADERAGLKLPR